MNTDSFNFMQEIFSTVLSYSLDLFAYIDKETTYQYVSESYSNFYDQCASELVGLKPKDIFDPDTYENIILPRLNKCFETGQPVNYQSWVKPKGCDDAQYLYITYLPHYSKEKQKVVGIIVIAKDVTEFKRAESLLAQTANTDALTNIPNRLFLTNKLRTLSQNANRESDRYALLFCDLDGFKGVNDQHGHAVGDRILAQVAKRMQQHIRKEDVIARFGGDEFVILVTDGVCNTTLNTIRNKIFKSISQPFNFSGSKIKLGISIGVAIYPDDGLDPEALLVKADTEMYSSKISHR